MFLLAVVIAHSMLWLPQIVRSALRERRGGLTIEYLVGTTICRLLLAFCLYLDMFTFPWTN